LRASAASRSSSACPLRTSPAPRRTTSCPTRRSSDLVLHPAAQGERVVLADRLPVAHLEPGALQQAHGGADGGEFAVGEDVGVDEDRKSTRLNSSHVKISYAVFCLKKKKNEPRTTATN